MHLFLYPVAYLYELELTGEDPREEALPEAHVARLEQALRLHGLDALATGYSLREHRRLLLVGSRKM